MTIFSSHPIGRAQATSEIPLAGTSSCQEGSKRLLSRRLAAGSRVVAVLSILREPVRQINYGSGADVSKETIADAKSPLEITWLATSYIDVPASRN